MKKALIFLVLAICAVGILPLVLAQNEAAGLGNRGDNRGPRMMEGGVNGQDINNTNTTTGSWRIGNAAGGMRVAVAGLGGLKERIVEKFMTNHPVIVQKFLEQINSTNKSAIINNLDRARLENCLNDTTACTEKIKDWKVENVKVKNLLKKRDIAQDKLLRAENEFLRAKEKYDEDNNAQLRVRDEFLQLKNQLAKCKASGKNCSDVENQTFEKAQSNLLKIDEKLIDYLNKVKSKVNSSENINDTEAQSIISDIDSLIAQLDDAQTTINSATNKTELTDASKLLNGIWKNITSIGVGDAERVINAQIGQIFARSELLEKKLEVVVQKLKDKGINTTDIEAQLDNFSAKIDDARNLMTNATAIFAEIKDLRAANDTAGAQEKLAEYKNLTTQAHQDLKDAHTILMSLVHMINQKGESFNPDAVNESEDVTVVSEDGE